ncbi:MAG: hypothetical protein C4527_10540 [Candidatus Omnitrophota bacterium]|jgi:hypothetical protein|nr:MAG: hypothetical protein C4527_10540 [Candidatus Omnitrophota bacterium]
MFSSGLFCYFVFFFTHAGQAAIQSAIQPLSEFSPAELVLKWNLADSPADVTTTIYQRRIDNQIPSLWQPVPSLTQIQATEAIFHATHGQCFQLRSEISSPAGNEMIVLADFDRNYDLQYIGFTNAGLPFHTRFSLNTDDPAQGIGYFGMSFRFVGTENDAIPPDAFIGLPFNSHIPLLDWSQYRFLEFNYWCDIPGDMSLYIRSASEEIKTPVLNFSETGNQPLQWHSIVVDLDQELGKPENRARIKAFGLIKGASEIDQSREHAFRLDGIRLWASRNIQTTTFDATPPTLPGKPRYELKNNRVQWTWEPAEEDLCDVVGYSFSFELDQRIDPPLQVMTDKTEFSFPFRFPVNYTIYYFKVRAQNSAGQWSDIAMERLVCNPSER